MAGCAWCVRIEEAALIELLSDEDVDGLEPEILRRARRAGMSDEEIATLVALSPARRRKAVRRLRAVLDWHAQGGHNGPAMLKEFAAPAGVTPTRFGQLAQRWSDQRTMDALGVFARNPLTRTSKVGGDVHGRILGVMRAVVSRDSDASFAEVHEALKALNLPRLPARATLFRWLKAERADATARAGFGADLALDYVAVGLVEGPAAQHEFAALLDASTGLVLGAAPATGRSMSVAYAAALVDAVLRLRSFRLHGVEAATHDAPFRLSDVAAAAAGEALGMLRFLKALGAGNFEKSGKGPGIEIRQALSGRLGRVPLEERPLPSRLVPGGPATLHPWTLRSADGGSAAIERPSDLRVADARQFAVLLRRAVSEHDEAVLARLGSEAETGAVRAARRALAERIEAALKRLARG